MNTVRDGLGIPDPFVYNPLARAVNTVTPHEMQELLWEFGGYIARLSGYIGEQNGYLTAYREAYGLAIKMAGPDLGLPKNATEAAKEAKILSESKPLQDVKKLEIQAKAFIALAVGWREAYEKAWESVSRTMTWQTEEASFVTRRQM